MSADHVRLPAEDAALSNDKGRDVLREAGIAYSTTSSPDDPHVVVRRADVERLVLRVQELESRESTLASARAIRASMGARRTPAGRETPSEDVERPVSDEEAAAMIESAINDQDRAVQIIRLASMDHRTRSETIALRVLTRRQRPNVEGGDND